MVSLIELRSPRLCVAVAVPGILYRRTRFDWCGFVTQVTLDDTHTFCGAESAGPGVPSCDGEGLCGEFGIFTPVGFRGIRAGKRFPKLGVGLLTRPDREPYRFSRDYPCTPFPTRITQSSATELTFLQEPCPCRGYAVRYEKRLRVSGRRLEIRCALENVGTRPVVTEEYVHNFLSFDGLPVGPEYEFGFSFQPHCAAWPAPLTGCGSTIGFAQSPATAFYCRPTGFAECATPVCTVRHRQTRTGVRMWTDFPWAALALWGTGHVLSPELFLQVNLAPGGTLRWTRFYEFGGVTASG